MSGSGHVQGQVQVMSRSGPRQVHVRYRSGTGQVQFRSRSDPGQGQVRGSGLGQAQVRPRSEPGQVMRGRFRTNTNIWKVEYTRYIARYYAERVVHIDFKFCIGGHGIDIGQYCISAISNIRYWIFFI
jgi:hypothetical protein